MILPSKLLTSTPLPALHYCIIVVCNEAYLPCTWPCDGCELYGVVNNHTWDAQDRLIWKRQDLPRIYLAQDDPEVFSLCQRHHQRQHQHQQVLLLLLHTTCVFIYSKYLVSHDKLYICCESCLVTLHFITVQISPCFCRFDDRGFDDRSMEASYKQIQVHLHLLASITNACLQVDGCQHIVRH